MASESDKPYLPFEIIINILQRLPIKSIVRFQCVCKDWKNLFTIPSFIAEQFLHSARENPFLLIHEYDYKYRRSSLRLLNQKMETAEVLSTHSIDSFRRRWRITGSCNGLLCVELDTEQGRFPISYLLWNPVMNEVREVPQILNDFSGRSRVGFGYSSVVNDFKIVRFYHPMLKKKEDQIEDQIFHSVLLNCAQMFSLSTGSWKKLEYGGAHTEMSDAVSANGKIFWFGCVFPPFIVSFHIATEVFTYKRILYSVDVDEHRLCPYRLNVHGNKLAVCDGIQYIKRDSRTYSVRMWVVEEGDSESGHGLICTEKYKVGPLATDLKPLCIWRNQIVCIYVEGEVEGKGKDKGDLKDFLYLFNLTTKEWTKFHNFSAAYGRCAIFNYERSLVSVCNI